MAAVFDNLEDIQSKFNNTVCYYDGKAISVRSVKYHPDSAERFLIGITPVSGRVRYVDLTDKAFNYTDYNIGYNNGGVHAAWWFRKPCRQYHQGLKSNQMGWVASDPMNVSHSAFSFSSNFTAMLENTYPDRERCKKVLQETDMKVIAFNRDFAIGWDNLHEDFVLEYKGQKIGIGITSNLDKFRLMDEYKYLHEALEEAI